MIIDLHIKEDSDIRGALYTQLDFFEKELDRCLMLNIDNVYVIHGIGEGILKREVHNILKSHPHVSEYINEYHPSYGWGSTKIIFK